MKSSRYISGIVVPMVAVAAADVAILIDFPILRQVLGFVAFTTVPGWLTLQAMRLRHLGFIEKLLFSVGLSVAFLMWGGFLVNGLDFLIPRPLSLRPLLVAFNAMLLILVFLAWWRNSGDFQSRQTLSSGSNLEGKLIYPLLFPALFPILSFFGTHLMNTQANNVVLLVMLGLIPAYLVAMVLLRHKVHGATYPMAIVMISVALLLMRGLTSNHIMGRDIFGEYYLFQLTARNAHWNPSEPNMAYNAVLSTTLLPVIYYQFLGVSGEYVFKVVFPLILSLTPVAIWLTSRKHLEEFPSFMASLLFIFQIPFLDSVQSAPRSGISILLFCCLVVPLFNSKIPKRMNLILVVIFGFSVIASHYTTGYVLIFWMLFTAASMTLVGYLAIGNHRQMPRKVGRQSVLTFSIFFLFCAFLFSWYSKLTGSPFEEGVKAIGTTLGNIVNFLNLETRHGSVAELFGAGVQQMPGLISVASHDAVFALIVIGALHIAIRSRSYIQSGFQIEFVLGVLLFVLLLTASIALPYISTVYAPDRLFLQGLVFLAPVWWVGARLVVNTLRHPSWLPFLLCSLLILQFAVSTSLNYHFARVPLSAEIEATGKGRDEYIIYDQELSAVGWLKNHGIRRQTVYGDLRAWTRLLLGLGETNLFKIGFLDESMYAEEFKILLEFTAAPMGNEGYIFLRSLNVKSGQLALSEGEYADADGYERILDSSLVYTSNRARIEVLQ
jgi:uncharacterized membrane protein